MRLKWIFFDVGSTLVDESAAYRHRMEEIAKAAGVSYETVYNRAMEFYAKNQKGDLEAAKLLGVALPKWHTEDEVLYSDTEECLRSVSQRYRIGVIANQSAGTAGRLERHGILKYIDLVVASAEEGVAKPDARIFEIALERAGCQAREAFMVGDRVDNDIIPAKALGMRTIWVRQGFGKYWNITSDRERAEYAVDCLAQVAKRV
ncbi:MAG: HAD family hydrolase [Roseburia sp.]|nr:HAD family hydrolase [Roseburia sp.]